LSKWLREPREDYRMIAGYDDANQLMLNFQSSKTTGHR
jgi:hypothetical protein